ncbi:MAG: HAMP domain-containing sensor histidine kinase [Vicinamibacterales bacterium]
MMIRRRVLVTCVLIAVPAAAALTYAIDRVRRADAEMALDRVVRSQVNDQVRERCLSDPKWFLTGPLEGRPPNGVFVETTPDVLPPRPKVVPQPFELFAYDEAFVGSSSASARFPPDFRRALRASGDAVTSVYGTDQGTGVQMALPTGWIGTPCMYFLGRMAPPPHQWRQRALTFLSLFGVCLAISFLASTPTLTRLRRLAADARESAASDYRAIAPDKLKDELSGLTFLFNDASTELHLRRARIEDQDEALRRFVQATDEGIARPIASLEKRLAAMVLAETATREDLRALFQETHHLGGAVENLTAATRLRAPGTIATSTVNLNSLLDRAVNRHRALAHTAGVSLEMTVPTTAVVINADEPLLERAVSNVIDNAIRYNRAGGAVTVALTRDEHDVRFRLWIGDTGHGVTEEEFRGLTAIRRFRGDESRNRRPGAPGLGLSVAREVADRFKLQLDLKRPGAGGFEVEFSGPVA